MVSSLVVQLLHSIKFSMEVPFSNITQQPVEMQKTISSKKVKKIKTQLSMFPSFLELTRNADE
jgi:hypothetical protein